MSDIKQETAFDKCLRSLTESYKEIDTLKSELEATKEKLMIADVLVALAKDALNKIKGEI